MINKAMIEIPPRFSGMASRKPPDARTSKMSQAWSRAQGLAEDVRYYGEWMKQEAFQRIGHLYPKVKVPREQGGGEATRYRLDLGANGKVPQPGLRVRDAACQFLCAVEEERERAWVKPIPDGDRVRFEVQSGKCPKEYESYKTGRGATFKCPCCGEVTSDEYVKQEGKEGRINSQLMAVVAEGKRGRIYCSPSEEHIFAAQVERPDNGPTGILPDNPPLV